MSTEHLTDETPDIQTPQIAESEYSLDEWIDGIEPSVRSVVFNARPDVFGRYQHIQREIDRLQQIVDAGESTLEEQERLAKALIERDDLYQVQQRAKATWYVASLGDDVLDEITKAHPVPDPLPEPKDPGEKASVSARDRYKAEVRKYEKAQPKHEAKRTAAIEAQNLQIVARAVIRVEDVNERVVTTEVTVAQLERIKKTTHGTQHFGSLLQAATLAKYETPEIPLPFSLRSSRTAPS